MTSSRVESADRGCWLYQTVGKPRYSRPVHHQPLQRQPCHCRYTCSLASPRLLPVQSNGQIDPHFCGLARNRLSPSSLCSALRFYFFAFLPSSLIDDLRAIPYRCEPRRPTSTVVIRLFHRFESLSRHPLAKALTRTNAFIPHGLGEKADAMEAKGDCSFSVFCPISQPCKLPITPSYFANNTSLLR